MKTRIFRLLLIVALLCMYLVFMPFAYSTTIERPTQYQIPKELNSNALETCLDSLLSDLSLEEKIWAMLDPNASSWEIEQIYYEKKSDYPLQFHLAIVAFSDNRKFVGIGRTFTYEGGTNIKNDSNVDFYVDQSHLDSLSTGQRIDHSSSINKENQMQTSQAPDGSFDISQYSIEELLALQEQIDERVHELRIQDAIENGDRKIEFSENEIIIYNGQTQKLDATVVQRIETAPKNTKLVWSSSDPDIATVSNGSVKGINAGDVTIKATAQDNEFITSSITVHVRNSVNSLKLVEPTINLLLGDSEEKSKATLETEILPENAFDKTLTMSSSDEKIVTVSETGELQAVSAGKAIITVTTKDESLKQPKVAKCTVTVLQAVQELTVESSLTLNKSQSSKLNPVVLPDNASNKKLTFTSSDPSIVSVSQTGALTAKACGSCNIICTATDGSGTSATCHVTVIQRVTGLRLSTTSLKTKVNNKTTLQTTINPQDATNKLLKWSTSNKAVAEVDSNGTITAKQAGECIITVATTDGSNLSTSVKVTVENLLKAREAYNLAKKMDADYVNKNNRLVNCSSSYTPNGYFKISDELFQSRGYLNRSYSTYIIMSFTDADTKQKVNPKFLIKFYALYGSKPNMVQLTIGNNSTTLPSSMWSWSSGDLIIDFSSHLDLLESLIKQGGNFIWSDINPSSLCIVDFARNTPEYQALSQIWNIWKTAGLYELFN